MEQTSANIRWALVTMANHVDIQRRLQDEIDSVVGRHRLPSLDDQQKLPYVEAAILELMRYETISPMIPRETLQDTKVCGYQIPAGTTVSDIYKLHNLKIK